MPPTPVTNPDCLLRLLKGAPISCLMAFISENTSILTLQRLCLLTGYDIPEINLALDLLRSIEFAEPLDDSRWELIGPEDDLCFNLPLPAKEPDDGSQLPTSSLD